MGLLNKLFGKEDKPKTYNFEVLESTSIGDLYKYAVEAENRDEAFKKLVEYFYGEGYPSEGIKSQHVNVVYPSESRFITNMPRWFAKRISGVAKDTNGHYEDKLVEYCTAKGIKRKNY